MMTDRITAAQYRDETKAPKKGRYRKSPAEKRTCDGIIFGSVLEMKRYQALRLKQIAGLIHDLKLQPVFKVEINGFHFCKYTADFEYLNERGEIVIEEIKSTGTAKERDYKLRKKAAELYFVLTVTEVVK
jgi:hypothetical protein